MYRLEREAIDTNYNTTKKGVPTNSNLGLKRPQNSKHAPTIMCNAKICHVEVVAVKMFNTWHPMCIFKKGICTTRITYQCVHDVHFLIYIHVRFVLLLDTSSAKNKRRFIRKPTLQYVFTALLEKKKYQHVN